MNLTAAIACAASLLALPAPEKPTVISAPFDPSLCSEAGRETCIGTEQIDADPTTGWVAALVRFAPAYADNWQAQVHAGCHIVQAVNGLPHRGAGAERQCEWIEARADRCR